MERKRKSRKRSPQKPENKRVFTTLDEFSSHFFPKEHPGREVIKGKERGTKAAENAFTEIAKTLQT
jgi:hypothetical protein